MNYDNSICVLLISSCDSSYEEYITRLTAQQINLNLEKKLDRIWFPLFPGYPTEIIVNLKLTGLFQSLCKPRQDFISINR